MPKSKHISRNVHDESGGIRISGRMLATVGSLIPILGLFYLLATRVATKSDVESIKLSITPTLTQHESRLRDLEIAMARQFGASPTAIRPSISSGTVRRAFLQMAQYVGQMPPNVMQLPPIPTIQRPVVVPRELVERYKLQPSRGGVYALLGEDGRIYSLDEVIAVLIRLHMRGI